MRIYKLSANYGGVLEKVYHRTGKNGLTSIVNLIEEGFKHGSGDMYGPGLYSCFDIKSQLRPQMYGYGPYMIEYVVNTSKMLNFENIPECIDKVKLLYKNRPPKTRSKDVKNDQKTLLSMLDSFKDNKGRNTSDLAVKIWREVIKYFDGMMFTGGHDGKVCVIYNYVDAKMLRLLDNQGNTIGNSKNVLENLTASMKKDAIEKARQYLLSGNFYQLVEVDKNFKGEILKELYAEARQQAGLYLQKGQEEKFNQLDAIYNGKFAMEKDQLLEEGYQFVREQAKDLLIFV